MTLLQTLKSARRRGASLIVIRTADPNSTIESIQASYGEDASKQPPMILWDCVQGAFYKTSNDQGREALTQMLSAARMEQSSTVNLSEFLAAARTYLPANCILFIFNLHRFVEQDPSIMQAVWNLRDSFKLNVRTLIGLCPGVTLPAELSQDVLVLDEPLPTAVQLAGVAKKLFEAAQLPAPDAPALEKIVDATLGLAEFPAEQSMAMCLTPQGMDYDSLWDRKRSVIESTQGLTCWRGGETFADIGGCENVKGFLKSVIAGREAPRAIVFIDEIEKSIGTAGDTSGVSQSLLRALLTWMQDRNAAGVIFIGPPGAAKSQIAKATGNEAGIPTIALDLSGMKGSLVGESEARLRQGLKVIDAVSQGRALFVATCNSIGTLPPELRRRFGYGTYFFPLPDAADRAAIWSIYRRKFELSASDPLPEDSGWTGAEIRQACQLSYRLNMPLAQCAQYIVPVFRSAAKQIQSLCEQADGNFISASYPGVYRHNRPAPAAALPATRAISFAE